MPFLQCLAQSPLVLTECAISERLRRMDDIELHPQLFNTPLIYEARGRKALEQIYLSYRQVAQNANVPILLCAPTWRIDQKQTTIAGASPSINRDAVTFVKELATQWQTDDSPVFTGSLLAPKNDCYSPEHSLSRNESSSFHSWQIDKLIQTQASVIIAQTMPSIQEALGMADVLSLATIPYIISFVIDCEGRVLDGTPLWEAIQIIDNGVERAPTGYMVNCVYPTFIGAERQPTQFFTRLLGIQANASSKNHKDLDGAETLQQDPLPDWGKNMLHLHNRHRIKILGGCCGTDDTYLQYLMDHLPR